MKALTRQYEVKMIVTTTEFIQDKELNKLEFLVSYAGVIASRKEFEKRIKENVLKDSPPVSEVEVHVKELVYAMEDVEIGIDLGVMKDESR